MCRVYDPSSDLCSTLISNMENPQKMRFDLEHKTRIEETKRCEETSSAILDSRKEQPKDAPEKELSALLMQETGIEIKPNVLSMFIRANWNDVAKLSHQIHEKNKSNKFEIVI